MPVNLDDKIEKGPVVSGENDIDVKKETGEEMLSDEKIKELAKEFYHVVSNKISSAVMYPALARNHPDDPEIKDIGRFASEDLKIALNWIQNFKAFVELNSNFKSFITVEQLTEIEDLISKSLANIENNDYASTDPTIQESAFKNIKELQFKYDSTKVDAIQDKVIIDDSSNTNKSIENSLDLPEESIN